jgi:hypothetical protein
LLVRLIRQIRQGHAKRPVWRFEPAAVQQHNSVCLGKTEGKIERMLIDERVDRTPQLAPFGAECGPIVRRNAGDNQGLEIGAARTLMTERKDLVCKACAIRVESASEVAGSPATAASFKAAIKWRPG